MMVKEFGRVLARIDSANELLATNLVALVERVEQANLLPATLDTLDAWLTNHARTLEQVASNIGEYPVPHNASKPASPPATQELIPVPVVEPAPLVPISELEPKPASEPVLVLEIPPAPKRSHSKKPGHR